MPANNNKKQPEAIARLKGVYKPSKYPDSIQDAGITYLTAVPEPPDRLNAIGQKFWIDILSGAVHIQKYIAVNDIFIFEELCYCYQIMTAAKKDVEMFGHSEMYGGRRVRSFGSMMYKDALQDFTRLCREFGISPSSRSNIKFQGGDSEEADEFADLSV